MQPKVQTVHFDLNNIILTWKSVLYNLFLITAGIIVFVKWFSMKKIRVRKGCLPSVENRVLKSLDLLNPMKWN